MAKTITISAVVHAPLALVFECWTKPEHIKGWCFASPDWEVGDEVENDVRVGGECSTEMRAKDGSVGFIFRGTYTKVEEGKHISYTIEDGRTVSISFEETPEGVAITETFEMENENSEEMQRDGWQSILNNFKTYTESAD